MSISTINDQTPILESNHGDPFSIDELQKDIDVSKHRHGSAYAFTPDTVQTLLNAYTRVKETLPVITWTPEYVTVDKWALDNRKLQAYCSFIDPVEMDITKINWCLSLYSDDVHAEPVGKHFIIAVPYGLDKFLCISDPRVLAESSRCGASRLMVYVVRDTQALNACTHPICI